MNKYVKVIGLAALVGIVALATASVAFAQGGTPPTSAAPFGPGWGGMMGGNGVLAQYQDQMHTTIAKALGLSLDEFNAALAAGKTPWLIAQEKGIDAATLQAAMQEAHAAALQQAVQDGVLTQAQADWMLSHQSQMLARHSAYGYGAMMGRGLRGANGTGAGYGPCHGNWVTPTPAPAS